MVLNTTVVFASDDSADGFENAESNPLSTYETNEESTVASTYIETTLTSEDGEEYTTTLEISTGDGVESLEEVTTIDPLNQGLDGTTIEDTSETTTELETIPTSALEGTTTGLEKSSYVEGNVYFVNPSETTETNSVNVAVESNSTSYVLSQTSSIVHTLSNTNVKNDDSSPKTDHVAVIVPILLVMAGALFIGATSTPKRQ
jgi:hypothetical protein